MNTRLKLIKTGALLFAKKSFVEVTVEDVVRKANVSKGAFYHYFSSKEDFYREIIKEANSVFERIFQEKISTASPDTPKLKTFIEAVLQFYQSERNFYIIIQNEINKIVAGTHTPFYEFQQKLLSNIKTFAGCDEPFVPYFIMGTLRSAIIYKIQHKVSEEDLMKTVWNFISRALEVKR